MRNLIGCVVCFIMLFAGSLNALAGDCRTDSVSRRWVDERNRAEILVMQAWARGEKPDAYAEQVALILADELYLAGMCRDDGAFLKENLHILGKASDPTVATIPGMILEQFLGKGFLSPERDYGSTVEGGAKR